MKEHPLLAKASVVQAILDGRQTQDRRPMKPQPVFTSDRNLPCSCWYPSEPKDLADKREPGLLYASEEHFKKAVHEDFAPYQVGDHLWVRETFWRNDNWDREKGRLIAMSCFDGRGLVSSEHGDTGRLAGFGTDEQLREQGWVKHPSIHMPRWASRITLEVTGVWCERITKISAWDATQEGLSPGTDIIFRFQSLWQSLYPGSWQQNQWVWVYEFKTNNPTTKGADE